MDFKSRKGMRLLSEFLTEARMTYSYESGGSTKERRLEDETNIIGPYTVGKMTYIDTYKGNEHFKGKEEILFNDNVLWTREYDGGIINHSDKADELYKVLRLALKDFPRKMCFKRGPDSLKVGEYLYTDVCKGDIVSFKGSEIITHNNRSAYALAYGGGLVKIK